MALARYINSCKITLSFELMIQSSLIDTEHGICFFWIVKGNPRKNSFNCLLDCNPRRNNSTVHIYFNGNCQHTHPAGKTKCSKLFATTSNLPLVRWLQLKRLGLFVSLLPDSQCRVAVLVPRTGNQCKTSQCCSPIGVPEKLAPVSLLIRNRCDTHVLRQGKI